MRVLLADRDMAVRAALRLLLTHALGLEVAGEVADVAGLPPLVRAVQPDVLLLDWRLCPGGAASLLPALRALRPGLRIVVLDGHAAVGPGVLAAGAAAFICKADAPEQALRTLRAVCAAGAG